ncbi:MAG: prolyl oligopeptidase family serine peptidase [Gemmatimonadales bacterium]
MRPISTAVLLASLAPLAFATPGLGQVPGEPGRHLIEVRSSIDGSAQPSYLILPPDFSAQGPSSPIVVSLHSWSFGVEQRWPDLEQMVADRGWIYLFPNFRGRNDNIEACASDVAKQDVIDALDWVEEHYAVDSERVYVTGVSGGGFMTLAMVASYPSRWTAASAWVPLSDLRAWYDFHAGDQYGEMTRQCVGGNPADDPAISHEMERRSPLHQLSNAVGLPLDIAAGRFDGHDGAPIPVWHSLAAFNVLAETVGEPQVSALEIAELSRHDPYLERPTASDTVSDPSFGRRLFLRRHAGRARVTIFDGAHEGIPAATIAWFETHPSR